jgi:F-type H+-transporting ATPase subunit a
MMFLDIDTTTKLPPISIKAEPLFTLSTPLGDLNFTNSMLFSLIVMAAITLFAIIAMRRVNLVPRGAQNVAESVVELLLGLVEGTAGRRVGRRIFPLIATLFIFIVVANWSGLIPGVGTIGGCYTETPTSNTQAKSPTSTFPAPNCPEGTLFRPFLRPANADLNTTLAMALIAVIVVQASGVTAHGVRGYLKELSTPIFLTPIHIISELSRIISLSFRLFGNIFGGEVLVTVMYVLLGTLLVGFGAFIFLGLELFFGLIQALIFSILTLVYITTAVSGGHSAEDHSEEAHVPPAGSLEAVGQDVAHRIGGTGGQ